MLVKWSTFMAASDEWLTLKSREWSWKILGQLLRCTLSGGGGGEVELVSIVPTPALLPLAPLRFLNIHSHSHTRLLYFIQITLMCDQSWWQTLCVGVTRVCAAYWSIDWGDYEYLLGSNPFCNIAHHLPRALISLQPSDVTGQEKSWGPLLVKVAYFPAMLF